jgi:hypothetical protein
MALPLDYALKKLTMSRIVPVAENPKEGYTCKIDRSAGLKAQWHDIRGVRCPSSIFHKT